MLKYYVVDAFADKVFEGNPAGVCILDEWLPEEKMQKIAMENCLSETAFAVKAGAGKYELRWFTPKCEIDLCGHATFGTSYVLFRFHEQDLTELHFHGLYAGYQLKVTKDGELLTLDFPKMELEQITNEDYIADALGAKPVEVWRTERDMVCLFDDENTVSNMQPDLAKIKEFPIGLSVFVTAKSAKYDFVARAFWPKMGIDEDPVCGSMFCALAPFWKNILSKDRMVCRQVSRRGGTVYCEVAGNRVNISGRGALYSEATIYID